MQIDLTALLKDNGAVLAGMDRGVAAREAFDLDTLDAGADKVEIVAPEDLEAISPSFVQGFLSASYARLGESGLTEKYNFNVDEFLKEDLLAGIQRLKMRRKIAGHG